MNKTTGPMAACALGLIFGISMPAQMPCRAIAEAFFEYAGGRC